MDHSTVSASLVAAREVYRIYSNVLCLDPIFRNSDKSVMKKQCPCVLNCSSKTKKSMKMSTLTWGKIPSDLFYWRPLNLVEYTPDTNN